MLLVVSAGRGWLSVSVFFSHMFSLFSCSAFQWTYSFLEWFSFCIHGVTLPGTPLLSFCFLWMVCLTFKVKRHRTIFPLQIRAHNENVSGFSWLSVWLSFSAVLTFFWHCPLVLIDFNPAIQKPFCFPPTMNLQFCLDWNQLWTFLNPLLDYSSSDNENIVQ